MLEINAPSTSKMRTIANDMRARGLDVINFAAGELDFPTPDFVLSSAKTSLLENDSKYTPTLGISELRKHVALHASKSLNLEITSEQVGITSGAKQALFNIAMCLFDTHDEIIIPTPYWGTFVAQVTMMGAVPVIINTNLEQYQIKFEAVVNACTEKTKAIILNSPNNPSGVIYSSEELLKIVEFCVERNIWIISDECYSTLIRQKSNYINILELAPNAREKVVQINSFSKSFCITGWRIGYFIAPASLVKKVEVLQGHMTSNVNSIAQYAVLGALKNIDDKFLIGVNNELDERLKIIEKIISETPGVSYVYPDGAFYVFLDVSSKIGCDYNGEPISDINRMCELLLSEARVAVVSGESFGDSRCVRISFAVSTQDVAVGMNRVKDFLNSIHNGV